ncbi:MAG: M48 family peptidase [Salinarimonadaceae bacterium]|nr:MAG: M48 family peptidase [Salinarimonadaceae bacterium]
MDWTRAASAIRTKLSGRGRDARPEKPAEPAIVEIEHAGERFPVRLRRSTRARRISLRVSQATGEIVMTMPARAALDRAMLFARGQGGWIAARIARMPGRVPFADGAILPLRAEPHRIVHWSRVRGRAHVAAAADGAPIIAVSGEAEFLAKRVREFLQREARADLVAAVERYTQALGLPARKITLRDTRSRWGSCSSRGDLSFSWRLILAPPFVLDYLAAHECAHLAQMNHSSRYWRLLREICPRTNEAEAWLKAHGAGLHRYG